MRRPWNIVNSPVSAIATYDRDHRLNMNICTYMMAVSRHPKQYCIAIEKDSKTLDNLFENKECVIQILHENQSNLIRPLGKRSGHDYDKLNYLIKRDLIQDWKSFQVLKGACAYIKLSIDHQHEVGDHVLFTGVASSYKTISEEGILTFQYLIDQKIIL